MGAFRWAPLSKPLLAVGVAGLVGAFLIPRDSKSSSPIPKPASTGQRVVSMTEPRNDIAQGRVGGAGVVEPAMPETRIAAAVAGRIANVLVKEGDRVQAGDVLIQLESELAQAALQAADAELLVARAEATKTHRGFRREDIEAAVADADVAKAKAKHSADQLKRTEALGVLSSGEQIEAARAQRTVDEGAARSADAKQRAYVTGSRTEDIVLAHGKEAVALAHREQARVALAQLTIKAPIAGEVLRVSTRAGEYYSPGVSDPLMLFGQTQALRVRLEVSERDISRVELGASARVIPESNSKIVIGAKVVSIGRRMGRPTDGAGAESKILEVRLELESGSNLVPGQRIIGYVDAPN